jgi:DNA-binding CsgD family transcriptional regulator
LAWFGWLDAHSAFRYDGSAGRFAAHKQKVRGDAAYWQAFRRRSGKLRSVHLGRSTHLTEDRLAAAARALAPEPPSEGTGTVPILSGAGFYPRTVADGLLPHRARGGHGPTLVQSKAALHAWVADDGPRGRCEAGSAPTESSLTERELEVLHYVASGWPNKEICRELAISLGTVKSHLSAVYRKLGVESRTQALARAYALRLVEIGSPRDWRRLP